MRHIKRLKCQNEFISDNLYRNISYLITFNAYDFPWSISLFLYFLLRVFFRIVETELWEWTEDELIPLFPLSQVALCICIIASHSASLCMQMRVNNEPRPWPPHYSPPWNPQKSHIVSLRFHSQSSGTLFIVGWTESELRIDIRGPQTSLRIRSSDQLRCRQPTSPEGILPDMGEPQTGAFYLLFIVYNLKCMPVLLLLFFFLPGIYICSFCHSLEVGNSPAACTVIVAFVSCLRWPRCFQGSLVSFAFERNLSQFATSGTWLLWNCIYTELQRLCSFSSLFRPVMSSIS